MDTAGVIDRYYQTAKAGDWEGWFGLFDEHVVVDEQLEGHLEGIGALHGVVDRMNRGYSKFLMQPEHVVVEAEQACVIWHCEAANASGVPIEARGSNYFRVKDSRIIYMANFHDKGAFAPYTSQELGGP
jgi:ketosteroid isomerase-like protein